MHFHLVGISHKTAPVECRERLSVGEEKLPTLLRQLRDSGTFSEAVLLSTCNRVEVYGATADINDERAGLTVERALLQNDFGGRVSSHFYHKRDADALRHLCRVAAGLESLVVGETEILGQVKRAYQAARETQCTGKLTNVIFQRALFVGKLARTHTTLSEGATSVAALATTLAQRILGNLSQRSILIVGAGKMAGISAGHLLKQRARLTVINRTLSRARKFAQQFGARAATLPELPAELAQADVAIFSTRSADVILKHPDLKKIMRERCDRPLFLIDISVPRNVDPAVHRVENVYLYDIDDLEAIVAENLNKRHKAISKASLLVDKQVSELARWYEAWQLGEQPALRHKTACSSLFSSAPVLSCID